MIQAVSKIVEVQNGGESYAETARQGIQVGPSRDKEYARRRAREMGEYFAASLRSVIPTNPLYARRMAMRWWMR
jgi:hypothetical protein